MAESSRGKSSSILPFLPRLLQSDSGSLQWPSKIVYVLKGLVRGSEYSQVVNGEALSDCINDLREQSGFRPLISTVVNGITLFFDDLITRADAFEFFGSVLPRMADLVLHLPVLLDEHLKCSTSSQMDNCFPAVAPVTLRLLNPQTAGVVFLSQDLIAAFLACAFFCLYPQQRREEAQLPYLNFDKLFSGISKGAPQQEQKVLCLMHYFTRICQQMPQGMVSYERKVLSRHESCSISGPIFEPGEEYWHMSSLPLCPFQVFESGNIEDQKLDALEVDFANRYLGGGVLFNGCVQEEIWFVISPELIAGMLFMPAMDNNEAIEITGAERFSQYKGYSAQFCFIGDFIDDKPRDSKRRRMRSIVAIDALVRPGEHQFKKGMIIRETNKAFCGFLHHVQLEQLYGLSNESKCDQNDRTSSPGLQAHMEGDSPQGLGTKSHEGFACCRSDEFEGYEQSTEKSKRIRVGTSEVLPHHQIMPIPRSTMGIATGNWGCGAFGGDVELKSLLQWIAASQAGRPFILYYCFGGAHWQKLQQVTDWIRIERWCVGELWDLIMEYGEKRLNGGVTRGLFEWILPTSTQIPHGK